MKIYITIIVLLTFKMALAQESEQQKVLKVEDDFSAISDGLKKIDGNITTSYFSTGSYIKEYENRLYKVNKYLTELEGLENDIKKLIENQQNEKEYYVKLAIVNLTQLSIYSRKDAFISFLNAPETSNDNGTKLATFQKLDNLWDEKTLYYIKSVKQRIKIIRGYENVNDLTLFLESVSNIFEKDNAKAIQSLNLLIDNTSKIQDSKKLILYNADEMLGLYNTWLAYAYLVNRNFEESKKVLKTSLAYNEPVDNIAWAQETLKKVEDRKIKSLELDVPQIKFPKTGLVIETKSLSLNFDEIKEKVKDFSLKNEIINTQYDIQVLNNYLSKAWIDLDALEKEPWRMANDALDKAIGNKETKYEDKNSIFVSIDVNNKGYSFRNKIKFLQRLQSVIEIHNKFTIASLGFENLSKNNPNDIMFKILKIKAQLGLKYIYDNQNSYLDVLNFSKLDFQNSTQTKLQIKQILDNNPTQKIIEDLGLLTKMNSDNVLIQLLKMETSIYLDDPNKALENIETLSKDIPDNASIYDIDLQSIIEQYKSYIYFKLKDNRNLQLTANKLRSYSNTTEWAKSLSLRIDFLNKENTAKQNGFKF